MKTMNYFFMISLLSIAISCSNQDTASNEELIAKKARVSENSESEVAELHLHQHYLEGQLGYLNAEKERLIAQIEEGDEEAISLLEQIQEELAISQELYEYNDEIMVGLRLPRPPRPLPNPCGNPGEVLNCPAAHFLGDHLRLLVAEQTEEVTATLEDTRGRTTAEVSGVEPHETISGVNVHTLEFSNEEGILVISKQNPINGELLSYSIHFVRD